MAPHSQHCAKRGPNSGEAHCGSHQGWAAATPARREACRKLWRFLGATHSLYGRLVFLASLRDRCGRYSHASIELSIGGDETHALLESTHRHGFATWIALPLAEQSADLREWVASQENRAAGVSQLSDGESIRMLVPRGARDCERDLFIADLRAVAAILTAEYGAPEPDGAGAAAANLIPTSVESLA